MTELRYEDLYRANLARRRKTKRLRDINALGYSSITGPEPTFLDRIGGGPIKYFYVSKQSPAWRLQIASGAVCEINDCAVGGGYGPLVFDHCHEHGWVRGLLCQRHNIIVGQIETATRIPGVRIDISETPYAAHLRQCEGCTNSWEINNG